MINFLSTSPVTLCACLFMVVGYAFFCGYIIGKSLTPTDDDDDDGGDSIWDVPDYPPDGFRAPLGALK